ncbi:hypothetical protein LPB86_03925 [Pedobacter sp. MC2016-14]|uniref:hypothetical protein n=1 Tax=Pedobacter sp. MC2016-14 TaxID=2897327 RepID=UPI001E563FB1|nr:hypothetical protein [Pedobacter sp. MC2016-14]MCD0487363.1 hypothetical protein [Pedobacter sp. MC2016-14]
MKKIIKPLFALIISLIVFNADAQNINSFLPKGTMTTPNSASLAKFIDFPVSKYKGIPKIDIPIFDIDTKGFKLPISLAYNSSGIKVNEDSGVVGLGWSINLGGQIMHEVRGNDDIRSPYFSAYAPGFEDKIPYPTQQNSFNIETYKICTPITANIASAISSAGIFYPMSIRGAACSNQTTDFSGYMSHTSTQYNSTEYEPDLYHLSVGNFSTTFALKRNGVAVEKNPTDSKIGFSKASNNEVTWNIYDRDGNHYFFEKKETTYITPQVESPLTFESNWFVTRIETANNDRIDFIYLPRDTNSIRDVTGLNEVENSANGSVNYTRLSNKHLSTHLLTGITFPNGKIEIAYGNRNDVQFEKRIDQVKIYNLKNDSYSLIKNFKFNYDYFISNFTAPSPAVEQGTHPDLLNKRLKLKSLEVGVESELQKYNFKYNEVLLPKKNSYARDHWGYFNGNATNNSLIAKERIRLMQGGVGQAFDVLGANREPDSLFNQCFVLEEIMFPTGGSTKFIYQTNDYDLSNSKRSDFSNTLFPIQEYKNQWTYLGGGLRVKSIETKANDQDLHPMKTEYVYNYFEEIKSPFTQQDTVVKRSYGIVPSIPSYCTFSYSTGIVGGFSRLVNRYSSPVTDVNAAAAGIGYSKVVEYKKNENLQRTKTEFFYHNQADIVYDHSYSRFPGIKNGYSNFNGLLLKEVQYRNNSGPLEQYSKIHVTNNVYKFTRRNEIWAMKYYGADLNPNAVVELFYCAIASDDINIVNVVDTLFNDTGSPVINEVKYSYRPQSYKYLDFKESLNSKMKFIRTAYKYPVDFPTNPVYTSMVSRNMLSPIVEEKQMLDNNQISLVRTNYFSPSANLYTPLSVEKQAAEGTDIKKSNFTRYDLFGNMLAMNDDFGVSTCYIWSYNSSLPVAELKNVTYAELQLIKNNASLNAFSNLYPSRTAIENFISPIRAAFPNSIISTYSYDPLIGITSMTDGKGIATYYEYDTFQRLKSIKDQNGSILKTYEYHYRSNN